MPLPPFPLLSRSLARRPFALLPRPALPSQTLARLVGQRFFIPPSSTELHFSSQGFISFPAATSSSQALARLPGQDFFHTFPKSSQAVALLRAFAQQPARNSLSMQG